MSSGFFEETTFKAKNSDRPWTSKEVDYVLDRWFAGESTHQQLATKLSRTKKSISRLIELFGHNTRRKGAEPGDPGRADVYKPKFRKSREGRKWTQNEKLFLQQHKERNIPIDVTLKVLCRTKDDLPLLELKVSNRLRDMAAKEAKGLIIKQHFCRADEIAPSVDILAAHQYLYYVKHSPILSDIDYDEMEAEMKEFGPAMNIVLARPGSDRAEDYPVHIRALALYLAFKYGKKNLADT